MGFLRILIFAVGLLWEPGYVLSHAVAWTWGSGCLLSEAELIRVCGAAFTLEVDLRAN